MPYSLFPRLLVFASTLVVLAAVVLLCSSSIDSPFGCQIANAAAAARSSTSEVSRKKTAKKTMTTPAKTTSSTSTSKGKKTAAPVRNSPAPSKKKTPPKPPFRLGSVALPPVQTVQLPVELHTLSNGFRLVLQPDQYLPAVAVTLGIRSGRIDETPAQHGFSRVLFQHLGGTINVDTHRTSQPDGACRGTEVMLFTEVGAPASLPELLRRHSARLSRPIAGHASAGMLWVGRDWQIEPTQRVEMLAYQGSRAYWQTAGPVAVRQVPTADLEAFRREQLGAQRLVLTVSGRFDKASVLEQVTSMFGKLAATRKAGTSDSRDLETAAVPGQMPTQIPEQTNQRVDFGDVTAGGTQYFIYGWLVPPFGSDDLATLRVVAQLLRDATGPRQFTRAGRFAGVGDNVRVTVSLQEGMAASLLTMRVDAAATEDLQRIRREVDANLLELSMYGADASEVRGAWSAVQAMYLRSLGKLDARAALLTREQLLGTAASQVSDSTTSSGFSGASGSNVLNAFLQQLAHVNSDPIRDAIRKYLTPIHRNLVERKTPGGSTTAKTLKTNPRATVKKSSTGKQPPTSSPKITAKPAAKPAVKSNRKEGQKKTSAVTSSKRTSPANKDSSTNTSQPARSSPRKESAKPVR